MPVNISYKKLIYSKKRQLWRVNVTSVTKSILRSPCNVTVLIKYTVLLKNTWNGPACGLYRWTRINYEMSFYSALQHLHQSSWSDIFRWSASAQTQIFTRITFSFSLSFSMGRRGGGGSLLWLQMISANQQANEHNALMFQNCMCV